MGVSAMHQIAEQLWYLVNENQYLNKVDLAKQGVFSIRYMLKQYLGVWPLHTMEKQALTRGFNHLIKFSALWFTIISDNQLVEDWWLVCVNAHGRPSLIG